MPALIFVQVLISLINTSNISNGLEWVQMKLPFLLLPIGFLSVREISKKHLLLVLQTFVLVVSASAIYVLVKYFTMSTEVNYWRGDVMETPFSHIRYSLTVCMSIFTALYIFIHDKTKTRFIALTAGLWLMLFLHVLAVRSGLVAFYLSTLFLAGFYTVKNKKWIEGISFAVGLLVVPILAYYLVPTFKEKFNYVSYDISQYFSSGDASNLSDGQRLFSLKMGWEVFNQNKLLGVGAGDLIDEMNVHYAHHQNIEDSKRLPHNQWLWTAVSGGVIGLILLAAGLLLPVWLLRNKLSWYFIVFLVVLHSSMLSEATLESQMGVALYLIFYLLSVMMILQNHDR